MLVSIIKPAFNASKTIFESINSVQSQTYQNLEMIIIDDGSTDNTKDIITPFLSDYRIKYLRQLNSGPSIARNYGINNAKGKYLAFLDSDDIWNSEKLKNQLEIFKKSNFGLVCSNMAIIDENKNIISEKHNDPSSKYNNFSEKEWIELYKISENTFVEETEELKQKSAGAGLTDND